MPSKVYSAATIGLDSQRVDVEVDVLSAGLHNFTIVGLPDTAIKESRDRVSSAIKNSGFKPPHQCGRITVNLAPADLPKLSPIYDVPIALGFLLATGQLSESLQNKLFIGELALDGTARAVQGVLPIAIFAKESGIAELYVPQENAAEASIVRGLTILPIDSLFTLAKHFLGKQTISPYKAPRKRMTEVTTPLRYDMAHIKGQEHAKRALEISAAGGHNTLFSGPPGSGKTLLAKAFASILPSLTREESIEITRIYSVAGKLRKSDHLITERPFRAPHHSASAVALIGGSSHPRPGEISLAHRGVLFLDEFAEFPRNVLENLRQPLEDGIVTVSRAKGTLEFPAHFTLVAAMNPCACGNATDAERLCSCTPSQIQRYRQKISGPILDRIDIHVDVPRLKFDKLTEQKTSEGSATIRMRIEKARAIQRRRFKNLPFLTNTEMGVEDLKKFCTLNSDCMELLRMAVTTLHLSARAYHRLIKVARTIADLAGEQQIQKTHVAEAIQYRFKTE